MSHCLTWHHTCGLGTLFETEIFPSVALPTIAGHESSSNATCQSPARVIGVGKSVVKFDNSFPGNASMDALEIKLSVKSSSPQPILSWEEEFILRISFWQFNRRKVSNSCEFEWLFLMEYWQTWAIHAHRFYLEWSRRSDLWRHMLGDFLSVCVRRWKALHWIVFCSHDERFPFSLECELDRRLWTLVALVAHCSR